MTQGESTDQVIVSTSIPRVPTSFTASASAVPVALLKKYLQRETNLSP
jgi:hypothetical protein